jgi:hypothetical protein
MRSSMVSVDARPATPVSGIPYRMPERFVVEVFKKTDEGYKSVGKQVETIADPTKVYLLNFSGQALADSSLKIEQRPDGTLSTVHLTGASKAAETATSVAAGMDALQAAHKTLLDAEKAKLADQKAAEAENKTAAAAATQAIYDALTTKDAVTELELSLTEKRDTLKPSEVYALESQIRLAKLKANTAAVAAGQPIPYPNPIEESVPQ